MFFSQERQQPPYFEELDQLFEHLQTAGKKPVHMSQQTLDTLQQLKDEYEQSDIHERDSIGHFVQRQAVKLGFTPSKGAGSICSYQVYCVSLSISNIQKERVPIDSKAGSEQMNVGKMQRKG